MLPAEDQFRVISSGVADLVPVAEMNRKLAKGSPLRIKLGVDPTAPDLHLGHAVPLRKLRQFEEENLKLKRLVADLTLDKAMLPEVLSKKV